MDYTINSAIYEDISSDEESFEEDLFLNKNNAEEFVSECEKTSNIPTPESPTLEIPTFESPTPEIQTSEKKNSMTIQLIKKTVSYEDGRTEVMKEINFSYTEEMREVSPYERIIRQCPEGDSDVIIPNLYPSDEVAGENNDDHSDISENSESQTTLPDTDKMQKLPLERSREKNDGHLSPPKQMEQKKTRHGRIIKTATRFRTNIRICTHRDTCTNVLNVT
uniref:Uncharacterized protein n=1 Tax=Magallana gigas TaxID=29159 RepID=A0A8W8MMW3_MAGGI